MKMLETTLSIGRTINLGNYESLRVDLSIKAEINSDSYSEDLKSMEGILAENLKAVISRQQGGGSQNNKDDEFI
jgi:hypothetical protein